ncbi:MAG: hypothetical protein JXN10_07845 [Clostridia bacterium]|nr:hypothetical protein [Clostridia bacterium]MBN2883425.1 hypothetical protein [Clostridia bacterium]
MPFGKFDRSKLLLKNLEEREHDLDLSVMQDPYKKPAAYGNEKLDALVEAIRKARKNNATVMMMMGAHVIRAGATPWLIRLMEEGWITHFATNGAGAIHDFEFSMIGATTESVAKYISEGQFGLWKQSGLINDFINEGAQRGLGHGEILGMAIEEGKFPHKQYSLLAAGYRNQIPVTVHVGIGLDFIHQHPNCNGEMLGKASYTDFLIYAKSIQNLENGVFMNFGSAVTGPEVYLKALSMARNVAHQNNEKIAHFTTAVFDLLPIEDNTVGAPPKSDPRYYFRPWKTILARTVADGGTGYYINGEHKDTVANLAYKLLSGD